MGTFPEHFPSFPVPAKNETIFSLFTRCKARSGFSDDVILRELTGQKLVRTLLGPLPIYLPSISGKLPASHPGNDPYYLIRNHSMFPYFSYFMPPLIRQEFETKLATTDLTQPIGLSLGLTKYPMKISSPPRFCRSCVKESMDLEGFPFFRVEHQLPGVLFCWKHAETLYEGCRRCGSYPIATASLKMAGHCKCASGIEPLPVSTINDSVMQPLLWLAEQSAYILGPAEGGLIDPALSIRRRALSEVATKRGVIDFGSIARKIDDFFGAETLRLLNIDIFSDSSPAPWIRRFFYADRGSRPTILYLILIGAYFQSIEAFVQYSLAETSDIASGHAERKYSEKILQKHRQILEGLVAVNPGISRGDIQKNVPGTYDFLIRHQKPYFQSMVQRAKAAPCARKSRIDWASLDLIKVKELTSIFDVEYTKGTKPTYITRTSALETCKIFTKFIFNSDRFPEVSKVLLARLESRESFIKRRLRWAIIQMTADQIPVSVNKLRKTADLLLVAVVSHRDFILSTIDEVGGTIAARSFLV